MYKSNHLTIEGLFHDPRAHMVNRLIFNGVTDAEVLIASTDKLLGFIGKRVYLMRLRQMKGLYPTGVKIWLNV